MLDNSGTDTGDSFSSSASPMTPITTVLIQGFFGAVGAAVYSVAWFARRYAENKVSFSFTLFGATVITGALFGAGLAASGFPVTEVAIHERLVMYSGVVAIVEACLKGIRDWYRTTDIETPW